LTITIEDRQESIRDRILESIYYWQRRGGWSDDDVLRLVAMEVKALGDIWIAEAIEELPI